MNIMEYAAGEGRRMFGYTTPSELPNTVAYTVRRPLGVVGIITPWNFPIAIPAWKMAPALICGNAIVFKPASSTPLCAVKLTEVFEEAGVPPGVLNLITGPGGSVGNALVESPDVAGISFTGSTEIGTDLYTRGASLLKKVQAEMGGKNAVILLADADLDKALGGIVQGAFGSTGQRCTATSRVIVEDGVYDEFMTQLIERTSKLTIGDGMEGRNRRQPAVQRVPAAHRFRVHHRRQGRRARRWPSAAALPPAASTMKAGTWNPRSLPTCRPTCASPARRFSGRCSPCFRARDLEHAVEISNSVKFGPFLPRCTPGTSRAPSVTSTRWTLAWSTSTRPRWAARCTCPSAA